MAVTVNTFMLVKQSGAPATLSTYNAVSAAVGTYLPIAKTGVATANSPTSAKIAENMTLVKLPVGAATGTIAVEVDGVDQFLHDYAGSQIGNTAMPVYGLRIAAQSTIAFRVVAALAA